MAMVCKLVPASNFVRQSRYKKLVGRLSVGGHGRKDSCFSHHGGPASEPKLDGSHPVPGRGGRVATGTSMG